MHAALLAGVRCVWLRHDLETETSRTRTISTESSKPAPLTDLQPPLFADLGEFSGQRQNLIPGRLLPVSG
jgi:hypothetical protein